MEYRCGSRSLSMPTHHTTRHQGRENLRYCGFPPPKHHYPCGDPRRTHPPWVHHAYKLPSKCAHSLFGCATPEYYSPVWRLCQLVISWWNPISNTIAYSSANLSIYKSPKENSEAAQATTSHTPPDNSRGPNKPAPCETSPRLRIQHNLPEPPPPRVHPKETAPDQLIARRTRSHTQNSQPPVDLSMQLKQSLVVTPSQAYQWYFPKALLALWSTPVTSLSMPVLNAEAGESLEYHQLWHHPKYPKIGKNPIGMN